MAASPQILFFLIISTVFSAIVLDQRIIGLGTNIFEAIQEGGCNFGCDESGVILGSAGLGVAAGSVGVITAALKFVQLSQPAGNNQFGSAPLILIWLTLALFISLFGVDAASLVWIQDNNSSSNPFGIMNLVMSVLAAVSWFLTATVGGVRITFEPTASAQHFDPSEVEPIIASH